MDISPLGRAIDRLQEAMEVFVENDKVVLQSAAETQPTMKSTAEPDAHDGEVHSIR